MYAERLVDNDNDDDDDGERGFIVQTNCGDLLPLMSPIVVFVYVAKYKSFVWSIIFRKECCLHRPLHKINLFFNLIFFLFFFVLLKRSNPRNKTKKAKAGLQRAISTIDYDDERIETT